MPQQIIPTTIAGLDPGPSPFFISGVSSVMRALERTIIDVAQTDIPVLVVGESGSGKEVVALEIHRRSRHWSEPFTKWGCAGLSADFLNARIHAGDAMGGAALSRNGTLFLDEIGILDRASQDRLVHLLPDTSGMPAEKSLDARVVSSTTCNLDEEIRGKRFLEGLFYRINGVCLRIPPLRQRKEDIPALLEFFLAKYSGLFGKPEPGLTPETLELLMCHDWPGNIRELENIARKMVAFGHDRLMAQDLVPIEAPPLKGIAVVPAPRKPTTSVPSLREVSREASRAAERELILTHLERTHWNRKKTARELQISYKALLYKLKQFGLEGSKETDEELSGDGK